MRLQCDKCRVLGATSYSNISVGNQNNKHGWMGKVLDNGKNNSFPKEYKN